MAADRSSPLPLIHHRVLDRAVKAASIPADIDARFARLRSLIDTLQSGALRGVNEVSFDGEFLQRVFRDVLGYRSISDDAGASWDLHPQKLVAATGGRADGALGFFAPGHDTIVVPIELKGVKAHLDRDMERGYTPVQQARRYANETPGCRWFIVSNFREIRLYSTLRTSQEYLSFTLDELIDRARFNAFFVAFRRETLLPRAVGEKSVIDGLLDQSADLEKEVTRKLYEDYRDTRAELFRRLCKQHPEREPEELLALTQKLLDRMLFVAFAEDRGLVPANTIRNAAKHVDPYNPRPRFENLKSVFRAINAGNEQLGIPKYNGGLFADDEAFDNLAVDDGMCSVVARLGDYDFAGDVSVLVLGHIFEQSISDLEELRGERTAGDKTVSKRSRHGVFYTPEFVTRYIVEQTLGPVVAERRHATFERLNALGEKAKKPALLAAWRAWRDELQTIRIIDPACGSGAFLIAAYDFLVERYKEIQDAIAELSGGQAEVFGWNRAILSKNLYGVDLNLESVEITRLSLWLKSVTRGEPLTSLDDNIRVGNSVVDDVTVTDREFVWEGAFAKGTFDAVIGNPPYVRQELLTREKPHLQKNFAAYHGMADLYVYFYELGISLLKPGGRLSFIVTNKWMRAGYGEALRALFARESVVEQLVDFGHAPIFEDADTFPCIIVVRRNAERPPVESSARVAVFPRELLQVSDLATFVQTDGHNIPVTRFGSAPWSLEPPAVDDLMKKIARVGVPLKEYLGGATPYRGVLTGFNEAFLIDQATRDRLVAEDPKSAEIIRPYLRGQDIKRWVPEWARLYMIFARRGIDIGAFPAVLRHLQRFRASLEPKPKDYDESAGAWSGRKSGRYEWFEIQDSVEYWELLLRPKIVYQVIQFLPQYGFDDSGALCNDKVFFIPTDDLALVSVLNSPVIWWHNWRHLPHMKDEALTPLGYLMEAVPIPPLTTAQHEGSARLASDAVGLSIARAGESTEFLDWLRLEHGVEKAGEKLEDFASLDETTFLAEVKKRRAKALGPLSPSALRALRGEFESYSVPMRTRRAELKRIEKEIAQIVYRAYQLSDEEIALLWKTAPPRMPEG